MSTLPMSTKPRAKSASKRGPKRYVPSPVPEYDDGDYIGDRRILAALEEARIGFESGDGLQLMRCLYVCARFQAVIPEWAADALISLERDIETGRFDGIDDAIGTPMEEPRARVARARQASARSAVLAELWRQRMGGSSLNAEELFTPALENLRAKGVNVNFRDVQVIYKEHGEFLKQVPRETPQGHGRGFADLVIPPPRRRGRGTLKG